MKSCPECTATYPDDYAICPKDGAPLHETAMWQIGTVVRGKYRIQARLGEGGMSFVYKAHHELLDELRALKVIKPELARDSEFMSRFKNEAIMARKLNHPNAVRVDDLDIAEDGLPFIAMELVVGDTLKTLVQRAGSLPVSLVLDVTSHVCEALDAAHRLGLVHRDIKPENIVLIAQRDGPPVAKILDFGISRLREETSGVKGLTQTGMVIGTPEYMSPEQALGKRGDDIDGRSDLYSLGVVMYRMLTGELPFKAETTVEMILQHLRTPPVPPHLAKPELAIPEDVSAIVMKALEKDREKRFATGAEMAAAFKKARGAITLHSRKIDWRALSSASASFGTEIPAPGSSTTSTPAVRLNTPTPTSSPVAPSERTLYRTSARIGPPPSEFPKHLALAIVGGVLLIGGAFAGWKYYKPSPAAKHPPASIITSEPPAPREQKPAERKSTVAPPVVRAPLVSDEKPPAEHRKLSYQEQAKVIELDSLADMDYNQGGCEKALPTYQQVLQIDPRDPRAYAAVQMCYAKARSGEQIAPATTPDSPPHP
jgi:eukaryotic-like serine/threonine-protein kinase